MQVGLLLKHVVCCKPLQLHNFKYNIKSVHFTFLNVDIKVISTARNKMDKSYWYCDVADVKSAGVCVKGLYFWLQNRYCYTRVPCVPVSLSLKCLMNLDSINVYMGPFSQTKVVSKQNKRKQKIWMRFCFVSLFFFFFFSPCFCFVLFWFLSCFLIEKCRWFISVKAYAVPIKFRNHQHFEKLQNHNLYKLFSIS